MSFLIYTGWQRN